MVLLLSVITFEVSGVVLRFYYFCTDIVAVLSSSGVAYIFSAIGTSFLGIPMSRLTCLSWGQWSLTLPLTLYFASTLVLWSLWVQHML